MDSSKKKVACKFTDAQEMAKLHPLTFSAPANETLDSIKSGSIVKVCANDKERFWVHVTDVRGGQIHGTVDNELIFTHEHGLRYSDAITFEKRHIYQVHSEAA